MKILKKIRDLIMITLGMVIGMAAMYAAFIGAIIQTSERINPLDKKHGIVIEQTYEGYSDYDDYYMIQFDNGMIREVESDDLTVGDEVTVYFDHNEPVRTVYGRR